MQKLALSLVLLATAGCYSTLAPVPATGDAAATPTIGSCTADWCVSYVITSQGHDLGSVWASAPNDVWVGDGFGTLLRQDGSGWVSSPDIGGGRIWGTSSSDVWIVGSNAQHWNGSTLVTTPSSPDVIPTDLATVWGTGPSDVWTGGGGGRLEHWDGAAWSSFGWSQAGGAMPWNYDIMDIWGSGPSDVWAVGDVGFSHWDGHAWVGPQQSLSQIAEAVWGSASNDVWAVGQFGVIGHWDGAAWSEVASGTKLELYGVWGSGPSDVWAVGASGIILHWDGQSWQISPSGVDVPLFGIYGTGPNDVWAVGFNVILHHS